MRWAQSTSGVPSAQRATNGEIRESNNQTSDGMDARTSGIPVVIGGFLVSVSGASAIGLFYSIRGIETKYRYLIAAILLFLIIAALLGLFSLKVGDSPFSAAVLQGSTGTISWDVMPVIESIQDTDPGNSVPDYPDDFSARNGLLFVAEGDGSIRLDDLEVHLGAVGNEVTLTSSTPFTTGGTDPSLTSYLEETGNGDGFLTHGEWLMVYADSCLRKSGTDSPEGKAIRWQPGDTSSPVTVFLGDALSYSLVDRSRGEVLQEGQLVFTDQS